MSAPRRYGSRVIVDCGTCNGRGHVVHTRLTLIREWLRGKDWQSTSAVAAGQDLSPTNAANHLKRLLEGGMVERRGSGANHSPYEWKSK